MNVAVIPARGGSKRIPKKNIRNFCGLPMIAWSIKAANESGCFDRVVVSTDDEEIAEIARSYGASIPFKRPAELSDDYTGTVPVVAHAIEWLRNEGIGSDNVCCLYATAPFVEAADLRAGLESLSESSASYVFSATSYAFPIQRALKIVDGGHVEMFYPEHLNTRSQDLVEAFHDAGQFYWGQAEAWTSDAPIFDVTSKVVVLPRHRVQDIDTLEDWTRAELMFTALRQSEQSER